MCKSFKLKKLLTTDHTVTPKIIQIPEIYIYIMLFISGCWTL